MNDQKELLSGCRKFKPAENRDPTGFTLLDLLVVIGTIGLFSVLLLPAFANGSKSQVANIQCANNLKQLGICLAMYTDGYQDYYPAPLVMDSNWDWIWPTLLRPYTGQGTNTAIYTCPEAAANGVQWVVTFGSGQPAQYGYLTNEVRLNVLSPTSWMSYGYNMYGSTETKVPPTGVGYWGLGEWYESELKKSQVVKPSAMIAIADSNWDVTQGGARAYSPAIGGWAPPNQVIWPLDVHGKRVNLVFCDGHVQAMKRNAVVPALAPDAATQNTAVRMWNYDNGYHYP